MASEDDNIAMQLGGLRARGTHEPLDEEGLNKTKTMIINYLNIYLLHQILSPQG